MEDQHLKVFHNVGQYRLIQDKKSEKPMNQENQRISDLIVLRRIIGIIEGQIPEGRCWRFDPEFASSNEYIHGRALLDMGCHATINATQIGDEIV